MTENANPVLLKKIFEKKVKFYLISVTTLQVLRASFKHQQQYCDLPLNETDKQEVFDVRISALSYFLYQAAVLAADTTDGMLDSCAGFTLHTFADVSVSACRIFIKLLHHRLAAATVSGLA